MADEKLPSLTNWVLFSKKDNDQAVTWGGKSFSTNFENKTLWSTRSKAFTKSTNKILIILAEQSEAEKVHD